MRLQKVRVYGFLLQQSQNILYIIDTSDSNLCAKFYNISLDFKTLITYWRPFMTWLTVKSVVDFGPFSYIFVSIV